MKRIGSIVMAAVVIVCSLTGCGKSESLVSKQGFYFDTVIRLTIGGKSQKTAEDILNKCFALCETYEDTFSRTKEDSELYRINHRTSNQVEVSDDVRDLVASGMEYYRLTDGKFDITIAPVEDLWDFKSDSPSIPPAESIEKAVEKVGLSKVKLEGNTLTFQDADTMIDLGALAKGYVADRLKEFLEEEQVTKGIINLGGNVLTLGEKEEGEPWKVGIQKPFAQRNEILSFVEASDQSVVSSGTYERYFKLDGKLYHHVLDPATGYPVDTGLSQVTILSRNSLEGDGLSTSCLLLGYEKGRALIDSLEGVEAVFVLEDGSVHTTEGVTLNQD